MPFLDLDAEGNVVAIFAAPQIERADLTEVDDTDPRVVTFLNPPLSLSTLRTRYSDAVDAAAGVARMKYITTIAGQEMTYLEKVTEARSLLADPAPDAAKYPLIYGEVSVTATDAPGVANVVLGRYAMWKNLGAAIEKARLTAKAAINSANTVDEMEAIVTAITWP
jgi:hypothetical protein